MLLLSITLLKYWCDIKLINAIALLWLMLSTMRESCLETCSHFYHWFD